MTDWAQEAARQTGLRQERERRIAELEHRVKCCEATEDQLGAMFRIVEALAMALESTTRKDEP